MTTPAWLDSSEYPFQPHFLDLPAGRLHYVDEGVGPPVLMVHGTPTWSFLYRHLISGLSRSYRCVALDHLGFGLSDKPVGWSYRPEDHAQNLASLIDKLELKDVTLVVHDFGGPIGLAYAIERPENVRALVIMNTFLWSSPRLRMGGAVFSTPLGAFLYKRLNFSVRVMMRVTARWRPSPQVYAHYLAPLSMPESREGALGLARSLSASGDWFDGLWRQRGRLADHPVLLAWGMKDRAFGKADLERWRALFPQARFHQYDDAGHFVLEEKGGELSLAIAGFLRSLEART